MQNDAAIPSILIVDDTPANLALLVDSFEIHQYRAIIAQDGIEALQRLETALPDLILLDVIMPGMDGFETCRQIKASQPMRNIPVIFMTSLDETRDKIRAFQAGAVDYVTKPLQLDEVMARVNTHLTLHAMQRHLEAQNQRLMFSKQRMEQEVAKRTAELSIANMTLSAEIARHRYTTEQLRNNERQLRTLISNSPDAIVRYDLAFKRTFINPAFEAITETSHGQTLNKTPDEFWLFESGTSAAEYMTKLQRAVQTGEPDTILLEGSDKNGKIVSYISHIAPEYDLAGNIVSILAIDHDISMQRQIEKQLRRSEENLRALVAQRESIRELERAHIARELHDELGQLLTGLNMRLKLLRPEFLGINLPSLQASTDAMLEIIDNAIGFVRNMITTLRPSILDAGIVPALQWLGQEFSQHHGIPCNVEVPQQALSISDDCAIALFRIVQESLTNIAKHAHASMIHISLKQQRQQLILQIRDNGLGFDPHQPRKNGSFGLLGMRERVQSLGGTKTIDSAPGKGSFITVSIPVPHREQDLNSASVE